MDAENACNGGKANGSHLDNGRANEFQSARSIGYVHDPIFREFANEINSVAKKTIVATSFQR